MSKISDLVTKLAEPLARKLGLHIADLYLVHLVDDTGIVWSQHLCAVVPIGLVAIVLARIV